MKLYKKLLKRIDEDFGYDNEKLAKDLEAITNEHHALQLQQTGVSGSFVSVSEQIPPENTELLVKSPNGTLHLCHWRPGYDIFTVQCKSESSFDWEWKIP